MGKLPLYLVSLGQGDTITVAQCAQSQLVIITRTFDRATFKYLDDKGPLCSLCCDERTSAENVCW